MPLSPEAKRLQIVYKDYGGPQMSFAILLESSQSSISRMMNGLQPITLPVTRAIIFKLGYAAEWFLLGTGPKKAGKDTVRLVTEIGLLRVDYDIVYNSNLKLEARVNGNDKEIADLKNELEELRKLIKIS